MEDLIEALQILVRYAPGVRYPTNCCHDLFIVCIDPGLVSDVDRARLETLSFTANYRDQNFGSTRFGSC